jgi:hypothetical protein
VGGLGKLAHCHPAMLTVFLQALSDVCVDGALASHVGSSSERKKWPDKPRQRFINIASNYGVSASRNRRSPASSAQRRVVGGRAAVVLWAGRVLWETAG